MKKITPFLWFDGKAEEAMNFYTSIFKNSKKGTVTHYSDGGPYPKGTVLTATFDLDGQEFIALNAGPMYQFTPAISFSINCDSNTQEEVDYYWNALTADGGEEQPCGWLKDKFGLSWQVVPPMLPKAITDKDLARAARAMGAMMRMKKIIIADIEAALKG